MEVLSHCARHSAKWRSMDAGMFAGNLVERIFEGANFLSLGLSGAQTSVVPLGSLKLRALAPGELFAPPIPFRQQAAGS